MFERFTEKAIKVIMLAQEEARRLGHNFVGTEQVLLGLIGEGTGIAAKTLKSMGVNLKDARVEVECEILISFDFDNPENTAQVDSFTLLNQGNICIDCRDATITQLDENELAIRVLREDMGYPRRGTS